jgi:hypothetical protein
MASSLDRLGRWRVPEAVVNFNIATLSLELPYRDEAHGQALAAAVIRVLETLPPLPAPGGSRSISSLRIDVPRFPPGTDDGYIARTVATAIHRSIAQSMGVPGPKAGASTPLRLTDPAGPEERDADAAAESGARPSISSGPAVARDTGP